MNWSELASPLIIISALSGGGKFYADNTYLSISSSLQAQLFELQRDIKKMELDTNLSEKDKAYKEFLELQVDQLREDLGYD